MLAYYILLNRIQRWVLGPGKQTCELQQRNRLVLFCLASPVWEMGGGNMRRDWKGMKSSVWIIIAFLPAGDADLKVGGINSKRYENWQVLKLMSPKWLTWLFLKVKGVSENSSLGNKVEDNDSRQKETQDKRETKWKITMCSILDESLLFNLCSCPKGRRNSDLEPRKKKTVCYLVEAMK